MGLTQGAGSFLAIKVCSLHPCGSLAQEFPAPAHVLSRCLFVFGGEGRPHGAVKLHRWVRPRFRVPQHPLGSVVWFGCLCLSPEFPPLAAVCLP